MRTAGSAPSSYVFPSSLSNEMVPSIARSLASASLREGSSAAMPPIACAPRRWHVRTSSSVYARMNGTAIVSCALSGSKNSGRSAKFLMTLKR